MQARAVLKAVETVGSETLATIQLTGLGNLDTFHRGLPVSHAIDVGLLAPGTDVIVELTDLHRPDDGQVVGIASVTSQGTGTPGDTTEQSGTVAVPTDSLGSGSQAVTFPTTYSAAPTVNVSANSDDVGTGTIKATAITTTGFTLQIHAADKTSSAIRCSWSSSGVV